MIDGKSILAVIPARGGSKRVPGKNLRNLAGKPMIQWTIDAAKKSKFIDTIAVSTEDPAIISHCSGQQLQIVERPMELATDTADIYDAIFHAVDQFPPHDYTMLLHPTSPCRIADDIDECVEHLVSLSAPSCITIDWARPVANGAVYIAWTTWLREFRNFDMGRVVAYEMPSSRSVDVDTVTDFAKAEHHLMERQRVMAGWADMHTRPVSEIMDKVVSENADVLRRMAAK